MAVVNTLAVLASGVTAGVYAHFAVRVMPRLGRIPSPAAVSAMQGLNRRVERPPFLAAFLGGGVLAGWQTVRWLSGSPDPAAVLAGGAGLAYLAGFVLTIGYNVPRNQRIARLETAADARSHWPAIHREWSRANVVRAALSGASAGLGIAALIAAAS